MHCRPCPPAALLVAVFLAFSAWGAPADPPGLRERPDTGYSQPATVKSDAIDRIVRGAGLGSRSLSGSPVRPGRGPSLSGTGSAPGAGCHRGGGSAVTAVFRGIRDRLAV